MKNLVKTMNKYGEGFQHLKTKCIHISYAERTAFDAFIKVVFLKTCKLKLHFLDSYFT